VKSRLWYFPFLLFAALSLASCTQLLSTPEEPTPTAAIFVPPTATAVSSPTTEPTKSKPTKQATEEPSSVAEPAATLETITEPTPQAVETTAPTPTVEVPTVEPSPQPVETAASASILEETSHIIQSGENLFRISLQYGLDWHLVATANRLSNPNVIYAGESLIIPSTDPLPLPSLPATHTVQQGENLYRIGRQYDIPWDTIARSNGIINPNRIQAGQVLAIPAGPPPSPPSLPTVHTVQRGENLYRIGLYYRVTWPAIAQANGIINPDHIIVGLALTIPSLDE